VYFEDAKKHVLFVQEKLDIYMPMFEEIVEGWEQSTEKGLFDKIVAYLQDEFRNPGFDFGMGLWMTLPRKYEPSFADAREWLVYRVLEKSEVFIDEDFDKWIFDAGGKGV